MTKTATKKGKNDNVFSETLQMHAVVALAIYLPYEFNKVIIC